MKKVIVYFNRKELISSAKEGIEFINSLKYRSSGHSLKCNEYTEKFLNELFENENHPYHSHNVIELATTGCSTSKIYLYPALADTLEKHDALYLKNKEKRELEEKERREKANQEFLQDAYSECKGWYVVTLSVLVSKIKGNDGVKTYSFKVLANSKADAFNKIEQKISDEGVNDRNVSFVYNIEDTLKSALIEFVGVWTDEAEIEYGITV